MKERELESNIISFLKRAVDPVAIYLFGSFADHTMTETSDVDIAFLLEPGSNKLSSVQKFDMSTALGIKIGRDIDLVDMRNVSTVFQFEILKTGICIYSREEQMCGEFEMLTISYYQKLNEERSEIIAEGIKSGRFYT